MIKGKHNDVLRTLDVNNRTIDLLLQAQPQIMYDQVNPVGDSITQINENSNAEVCIRLREQTKIVIDDIDDQVEGTDRKKRQALADPYGYKLWKEGVNFYFTSYLSARAQRAFMTGADMWQKYSCLNFTYNPDEICETTKSAQCEMGGFPNPRDCSKCVCPGGYAGDTCTERPDEGCGSTITATPEWKELTDVLGNYGVYQPLEDYTKCHYWIESPEGTDIVVEIVSLAGHQAVDGCIFTGVEIKTNEDQKLTGFRFCAPQDAGKTLVSSSNRVPIITWNKIARSTTILRFRHVPAAKPRPSSPTNRKASKKTATTTISTTHTRQTTGTPSSTAPTPTTAPPKCPLTPDHPSCPYHIKEGFCTDKESYTDAQRMQLCPRGCKLCVP
ncbi:hypothetical protein V3C99_002241 [Haemonchus contortus]